MDKLIEQRASFPDKEFKPFAVKLWNELFGMAEKFGDVAVCNYNADGSSVSLSFRDSSISDSDYQALSKADDPYAHIIVKGIDELLRGDGDDEFEPDYEGLAAEVCAWMEKGIMKAFHTPGVQKKYARYNPEGKRFSIVGDCYSDGVFGPELSLLWSHRTPRFTVAQIRKRQEAARKKLEAAKEKREAADKPQSRVVTKKAAKTASQRRCKVRFSEPFKSEAFRGWDGLFSSDFGFCSVIRFEIEMISMGTVTVLAYPATGRPELVSMIMPLCADELAAFDCGRDEKLAAYQAWVEKGILDSFRAARIQKDYANANPDGKNCAIVVSIKTERGPTEKELAALDLKVLWTNNPEFTVARIKAQDKARVKRREAAEQKRAAVRKGSSD